MLQYFIPSLRCLMSLIIHSRYSHSRYSSTSHHKPFSADSNLLFSFSLVIHHAYFWQQLWRCWLSVLQLIESNRFLRYDMIEKQIRAAGKCRMPCYHETRQLSFSLFIIFWLIRGDWNRWLGLLIWGNQIVGLRLSNQSWEGLRWKR